MSTPPPSISLHHSLSSPTPSSTHLHCSPCYGLEGYPCCWGGAGAAVLPPSPLPLLGGGAPDTDMASSSLSLPAPSPTAGGGCSYTPSDIPYKQSSTNAVIIFTQFYTGMPKKLNTDISHLLYNMCTEANVYYVRPLVERLLPYIHTITMHNYYVFNPFLWGTRERSPPLPKIAHPSLPRLGRSQASTSPSAMHKSPPGGTACLITVSPMPGKLTCSR